MTDYSVCKGRSMRLPQRRSPIRPLRALAFWGALLFSLSVALPAGAEPRINIAEEIGCLALNIYFEARGEPELGKIAVAHVVLNRVADRRFPSTVCDVVRQGGEDKLHHCQFSWWCDGQSDRPRDARSWDNVKAIAHMVYWGFTPDPTDGALWYHADSVSPYWRTAFIRGPKIGQHQFYGDDTPPLQLTSLPTYE
jgi:spore germination cell wall hydrolase CwlJ-like protein